MSAVCFDFSSFCRKTIRRIERSEDINQAEESKIVSTLQDFFQDLHENEKKTDREEKPKSAQVILKEKFGFSIERKQSKIKNAGHGVFVSDGYIPENNIAAMYPGICF